MGQLPVDMAGVVFDCTVTNTTKDGVSLSLIKAKLPKLLTYVDIKVIKGECVQLQ